jgi:glycosyltransferase involved in cell wall biosynthesis
MRVLFVSAGYPPGARGGTEIHARDLAVALRARGVEVAVFCRESDPSRKDYEEREDVVDGVRVRRLKYDFGDVSDFSAIHDNPKIDAAFLRFAKEFRPDVVHVHHVTCLSSGILDAARDGARAVVMTLHDFWTVCPRGQRITPKLERCDVVDRATCAPCLDSLWPHFGMTREKLDAADVVMRRRLNSMDALLAPSAAHRESMLEFGLDPARVVVLPHGLPLERYATARRPRAAAKRVGFIGSVLPTKGVHVLVDAFVSAGLKDATLAIYGEAPNFHGDTDYLRRLKDAAKGARVEFRGAYDPEDLAAILRDLDLVVAPSLWRESFCLTVREAFAAGVPAIASDLGGLSEAFEDGVGGRKVPPGDAAAIAARLSEVVGDPAAYARLVATVPEVKSVAQNAE